jgi:hypothetical protein
MRKTQLGAGWTKSPSPVLQGRPDDPSTGQRAATYKGPLIGLVAVTTVVIILLDCWATVVVARQIDLPRAQRRLQLLFIWLLPVVGAMISLRIHRPDKPYRARSSGASNDIYPAGIGPEDPGSHADGWD